ncbi:MAG: zinc-ribbon domain-containing protein [Acidimicrobiales bacterium]
MRGPTRRCPNCGAEIPTKAYQCSSCGSRMDHPGEGRSAFRARRRRTAFAAAGAAAVVVLVALLVLVAG